MARHVTSDRPIDRVIRSRRRSQTFQVISELAAVAAHAMAGPCLGAINQPGLRSAPAAMPFCCPSRILGNAKFHKLLHPQDYLP